MVSLGIRADHTLSQMQSSGCQSHSWVSDGTRKSDKKLKTMQIGPETAARHACTLGSGNAL